MRVNTPGTVALITIAISAAAVAVPASAAADPGSRFSFRSPSGNIACLMDSGADGAGYAVCKVRDETWAAPAEGTCALAYVPGSIGEPATDLQLKQGSAPCTGFVMTQMFFSGPYAAPTLGYGQAHTVGAITCGSERSGVTCTDSSTGHFFRVSRESSELG